MNLRNSPYFNLTQLGESRWWSWIVGFWFLIVGWIISQAIFTGPIPTIVAETNPELVDQFNRATEESLADADLLRVGLLLTGILLTTITTSIFWMINRYTTGDTRKIFGWLTGISMALWAVIAYFLLPFLSGGEGAQYFLEMIGVSPVAYGLMLASFPGTLVGLYLVQKFIHKRTIVSLHTAASNINWMRILQCILITWAVFGTLAAIGHFSGFSALKANFDPSRFFVYALVTLIFIPLQSGTEEIVFRGYLNQGFGHFISNKWIVFTITSVMFAAMHLANPEAQSGAEKGMVTHLLVMSQYFMFGFFLSMMVDYDNGLESAIGVHAGNNMFAAMFVNYEGSVLPTPSLFIATPNADTDAIVGLLSLAFLTWIVYRTRPSRTVVGAQEIA